MASHSPSVILADFPADLVAAVAFDAERDADRVGLFLQTLGLSGSAAKPLFLPPAFLLHLAAALRLLVWEAQGFCFHQAAGLPQADQAIRDAFGALNDPQANPTELWIRILRLAVERFAWHAPRDLGTNVALDDLNEETALDALADYLWTHRHAGSVTVRSQQ